MPVFLYITLNEQREEVNGKIEAVDMKSAAISLRTQGLYLLEMRDSASIDTSSHINFELKEVWKVFTQAIGVLQPVSTRERVFFFQQMALMIRSGLTILQALEICREQAANVRFSGAIGRVSEEIQAGKPFSTALSAAKRFFPPVVFNLIETAEVSGELDLILDRVALYMERRAELRTNIITSLTYPGIVVLVSFGVAGFLVGGVIPKFARFFSRRQMALPASTQFLMDISGFLQVYGVALFSVIGTIIFSVLASYTTAGGRHRIDRAILSIPVVGRLLTVGAMTQICRTLSMLLRSGVTLLESLRVIPGVVGNRAISRHLEEASVKILAGKDLAGSLSHAMIPPLVPQVAAVGERTGALDHVMEELAEFYDKELQASIKRMTGLMEPVMILIVGGMVGFVYYGFFSAVIALVGR